MKTNSFLIEIGCEDLPSAAQTSFTRLLSDYFQKELYENEVEYRKLNFYSTPRRIAIEITGVTVQEKPIIEIIKGPLYENSYDTFGVPTKACIGFAKACGVPLNSLTIISENNGSRRIAHSLERKRESLRQILQDISFLIEKKINIFNAMRWGENPSFFYRPVKWITSLFNREVVHLNLFNINSSDVTSVCRLSSAGKKVKIEQSDQYATILLKNFIIADYATRKALIKNSVKNLENKCLVYMNKKLLHEATNLTEWPILLSVNFNPYFLNLPKEVLINVLCSHMRSFIIKCKKNIKPVFIIVSSAKTKDFLPILRGYEKVVNAKFSDIKFFYQADKNHNFKRYLICLSSVSFQEKLGSLQQKTYRIVQLTLFVCKAVNVFPEDPVQISLLCKCDLVTRLVNELPELQGIIGCRYAQKSGESQNVSSGIREIYLPRYGKDFLPESYDTCIATLSDRLDTLVGSMAVDKKATGDKDPYGLRRISFGILRIIISKRIAFNVKLLIERSLFNYNSISFSSIVVKKTLNFLYQRMKFLYKENGCKEIIFDSIVQKSKNILDISDKKIAFYSFVKLKISNVLIALGKRIKNLLKKQQIREELPTQSCLFTKKEEKRLHSLLKVVYKKSYILIKCGMYYEALLVISKMQFEANNFLDEVTVLDEDNKIRKNRISILLDLLYVLSAVVDVSTY